MVDQAEFDGIADGLRADGIRPSVTRMRRALPRGGSPRAVSAAMKIWKRARGIADWQVDTGLPADVQAKVDAVTVALWEAARDREAASFDGERQLLKMAVAATEERLAYANAKLAVAERRLLETTAKIAVMEDEAAKARIHQDRRAREFWDRVLWAIGEVLEVTGPLMPGEIANRIPDHLRREAAHHAEKLTPSRLKKKLDDRELGERYVDALPDGRWQKRIDADPCSRSA